MLGAGVVVAAAPAAAPPGAFENNGTPPAELRRIEMLLQAIEQPSDLAFIRNGVAHSGPNAAGFLRMKWSRSSARISTAEDFVREIGSRSGTTGIRYRVRHANSSEEDSARYLGRLLAAQKLQVTNKR